MEQHAAVAAPGQAEGRAEGQADALYANRENLASAREAAALWERALREQPRDFDAAWKLARARHWLGDHAAGTGNKAEYEAGAAAARAALALRPDRPEGHFWLAANLGGLAERGGVLAGLKYRKPIREELEAVLRLDRGFEKGSAYCALSSYYLKVPRLFGGSTSKAEALARQCVGADPASTLAHYFLAECLLAQDRRSEARAELQAVLDAPLDPGHAPEGKEWKQKAAALLARIR